MSGEKKEALRRKLEELNNKYNYSVADELYAEGVIMHMPNGQQLVQGPEAVKEMTRMTRVAFPDGEFHIESIISEGDLVAYRWTARGTHKGEFMNIAPTGRETTVSGINILRLSGDKIVEEWGEWDALGFLQRVGAISLPESRERPKRKAA